MLMKQLLAVSLGATLLPSMAQAALYITIVQGLSGQASYEEEFSDSREKIEAASHSMTEADRIASFSGDAATRTALLAHFASISQQMTDDDRAVRGRHCLGLG